MAAESSTKNHAKSTDKRLKRRFFARENEVVLKREERHSET